MARCDHARRTRPRIALRIVDLIGAEYAAEVVDPAFAAEHIDLPIERGDAGAGASGRHGRARCPRVRGNVIGFVHPHVRRPTARIAGAHPPADGVELAVDSGDAVVVARRRHRRKLRPIVRVGVEDLERTVEFDRSAADESIGKLHPLRDAAAAAHVDFLADRHCRERPARRRHRRKGRPRLSIEIEYPSFILRIPPHLACVWQPEPAEDIEFAADACRRAVMRRHWIGRQLRPFILARIELPEDPHRIASGILTAVDKNLAIDLGADDFIGALRNRRAGAPFALGMGGRCRSQRECDERSAVARAAQKTVGHDFLP